MASSNVNMRIKLPLLAMILMAPLAVQAEIGDWYISPAIVYTDDDGDRRLDDSVGGGEFRIGWQWKEKYSFEGNIGYHNIDGWPSFPAVTERESQEFLDLGVNLVRTNNPDGLFSSYVLFGAGYLGSETDLGVSDSSPTGTAGVGFKLRFGQSRWSMRGEWRLRHAFDNENRFTDQMASLGLLYTFGDGGARIVMATAADESVTYVDPDTDGDGVVDPADACAGTPYGVAVDAAGCTRDSDKDGVSEDRDLCAGTFAGASVDADGCEIIKLKPVFFATESADLDERAKQKLDESIEILARHPNLEVEIGGHADSRGTEEYNMALSVRRAEAVRTYLELKGVKPTNLTVRGYGESKPVASNETAFGQSENRRVELKTFEGQLSASANEE